MKSTPIRWISWTAAITLLIPLTACTPVQTGRPANDAPRRVPQAESYSLARPDLAEVVHASYDPGTATAVIDTTAPHTAGTAAGSRTSQTHSSAGNGSLRFESLIDLAQPNGIINYATSRFANDRVRWVEVRWYDAQSGHVPRLTQRLAVPRDIVDARTGQSSTNGASGDPAGGAGDTSFAGGTGQVPPGVSIDGSIGALAPLGATNAAKFDAVLRVARSKLGVPYIWGHNEDRGQLGFDCSNFTAYVYHHALGYVMSGASRVQYSSVGWNVPTYQIQPGDLLVFEQGKHVGIAIGNGRMIEAGGGLGQVGYLSIQPRTYWGNHLSAVKRMY